LVAPKRGKATDRTLLDDGVYGSIAEMADKERINRSYLSRTIRLSLLAADIVEAILNGTQAATLQLSDLEGPFPTTGRSSAQRSDSRRSVTHSSVGLI
jgi:hypothetical protein